MKIIKQITFGSILGILVSFNTFAQVKVKAGSVTDYELSVLNQLGSPSAVVNMPVSQLLNAPGNEALRAFLFYAYKRHHVVERKKDCCAGSRWIRGD